MIHKWKDRLTPEVVMLFRVPASRWSPEKAQGMGPRSCCSTGSNLSRLRSHGYQLWREATLSAKLSERDPLSGESVHVLWVKGSGGDIGSMKLDGFSTLYLDKRHPSEKALYRGIEHEDGRDGGLPASLHLQSQFTRRFHRHAAACLSALYAY